MDKETGAADSVEEAHANTIVTENEEVFEALQGDQTPMPTGSDCWLCDSGKGDTSEQTDSNPKDDKVSKAFLTFGIDT